MQRVSSSVPIVLTLLFCTAFIGAQTPGKLAEGVYGNPENPNPKTNLHWEMAKRTDSGFRVESTQSEEPNITQEFAFSDEWKPISYSMKIAPRDATGKPIGITCQYLSDAISCDATHKGISLRNSLHVAGPKVFLPPGSATDMFWTLATVCAQADRTAGKVTKVAEVSIGDDPNDAVLDLEVSETLSVEYVGQEDLKTTFGTIQAYKFQIGEITVWTAHSGLLVAMTLGGSDSKARMGLLSLDDTTHRLLVDH